MVNRVLEEEEEEEEEELSDYDRPLNQQWKIQAVSTGKLIRNIDLVPDYIMQLHCYKGY